MLQFSVYSSTSRLVVYIIYRPNTNPTLIVRIVKAKSIDKKYRQSFDTLLKKVSTILLSILVIKSIAILHSILKNVSTILYRDTFVFDTNNPGCITNNYIYIDIYIYIYIYIYITK
jgi:hypothetical protein